MKQEKIIAAADILATQLNHWTLFSIAAAAAVLTGRKPPIALWAFCGLLPILFFLVRRYTNSFLLLAGSHFPCILLLFAAPVPGLGLKIILCLYGIGLAACSFSLRIRTEERLDEIIAPPAAVGIIALTLFLLHFRKYTEADIYFIGITAFYFTCYYIRCYLQNYLIFMSVNATSTGYIPRHKIFAAGIRLSLLCILSGMAAVLLLSNLDWLARIFEILRRGLLWLREQGFFAFLASLLAGKEEHFSEPMPDRIPASSAGIYLEPGEPGLFWQILENVIEILVPLFLLGLLLFALYRFIQMIRERFLLKKIFTKDDTGDDDRDIRERYEAKPEKKESEPKAFFVFLNPADKIRRIYKQRIGSKKDRLQQNGRGTDQPFESYTARECGNLLREEKLSLLYEKARYSDMECTREDVRNAVRTK